MKNACVLVSAMKQMELCFGNTGRRPPGATSRPSNGSLPSSTIIGSIPASAADTLVKAASGAPKATAGRPSTDDLTSAAPPLPTLEFEDVELPDWEDDDEVDIGDELEDGGLAG